MDLLILQNRMMTTVQRRALSTLPHCDIHKHVYSVCMCVFIFKKENIKISNSHHSTTIQMRAQTQLRIPSCFYVVRLTVVLFFFFSLFFFIEKGMWKV